MLLGSIISHRSFFGIIHQQRTNKSIVYRFIACRRQIRNRFALEINRKNIETTEIHYRQQCLFDKSVVLIVQQFAVKRNAVVLQMRNIADAFLLLFGELHTGSLTHGSASFVRKK